MHFTELLKTVSKAVTDESTARKVYTLTETITKTTINDFQWSVSALGVFESAEAAAEFAESYDNCKLKWELHNGTFVASRNGETVQKIKYTIQPTPFYED